MFLLEGQRPDPNLPEPETQPHFHTRSSRVLELLRHKIAEQKTQFPTELDKFSKVALILLGCFILAVEGLGPCEH